MGKGPSLSYSQVVTCTQAAVFCLCEQGLEDSMIEKENKPEALRVISNCCLALEAVLIVSDSSHFSQKQQSLLTGTVLIYFNSTTKININNILLKK